MPANYPKFNKKIQEHIDQNLIVQQKNRFGTIMSFDKQTNSATILLEDVNSELIGSVLTRVPCPLMYGVQVSSPKAGTRCVIGFRGSQESEPYIISYLNDTFGNPFFTRNYSVNTGIPKFMTGS